MVCDQMYVFDSCSPLTFWYIHNFFILTIVINIFSGHHIFWILVSALIFYKKHRDFLCTEIRKLCESKLLYDGMTPQSISKKAVGRYVRAKDAVVPHFIYSSRSQDHLNSSLSLSLSVSLSVSH